MPACDSHGRDVAHNDRTGLNDGALANSHAAKNCHSVSKPDKIANLNVTVNALGAVGNMTAIIIVVKTRDEGAILARMKVISDGDAAAAGDLQAVEIYMIAQMRRSCCLRLEIDRQALSTRTCSGANAPREIDSAYLSR